MEVWGVNQAIVDFWKSCNGQRKVTDLVEVFAQQTGLQRNQVEKEVMQLLQQLLQRQWQNGAKSFGLDHDCWEQPTKGHWDRCSCSYSATT